MAFDALRSVIRKPAAAPALADGSPVEFAPAATGDADGGIDAVAFGCPACGRTLARGTFRCEGCGQRLLLDVPIERAGALAGGGAAAGALAMLLLVNLLNPATAAPAPLAGTGTDPGTTGAGSGTGTAVTLDIPSGAAAALRGTTAINGRLASEAQPLASALAAKSFKTAAVVKILRRMSIDTRAGAGMVKPLAAWPEAAGQSAALAAFYEQLGAQIDAGLGASVKQTTAYRKAAQRILATLGQIPALDGDGRELAAAGGLELIPITIPKALE
jgi:hypothetical protein